MVKTRAQTVIGMLPELTLGELQQVKLSLDFLARNHVTQQDHDGDEIAFFYAIVSRVAEDVGLRCPPWNAAQKMKMMPMLRAAWAIVDSYRVKFFPNATQAQRQTLYRIFAEASLERMRRANLPIKPTVLIQTLGRLHEVMADAFPGYAEQGWLPMLLLWGDRGREP